MLTNSNAINNDYSDCGFVYSQTTEEENFPRVIPIMESGKEFLHFRSTSRDFAEFSGFEFVEIF